MNARRVFRNIFLGHALVLLLVFLCPGVSAGQGQVKTYRFGPVLIDVPVKEGYSVDTKGKNLVVSYGGMVMCAANMVKGTRTSRSMRNVPGKEA